VKVFCDGFLEKHFPIYRNMLAISLTFSVFFGYPGLADSSPLTSKEVTMQEIKLLAVSDVENDIPRRTEFIIKLYSDSPAGFKPIEARKIYEEQYFQTINAKFPNILLKNPFTSIGLTISGAFILGLLSGRLLKIFSKLKPTKVSINIPFLNIISLELSVDSCAKKAAWLLYLELNTRIATQSLGSDEGLLREALNSLYKIFEMTRQILRDAGPNIGVEEKSVGGIALKVLNEGLRPFLSQWHPSLEEWEAQRPTSSSIKVHEQKWIHSSKMRAELVLLQVGLKEYVTALSKIAETKNDS
jgi:hypothetical protein